MPAYEDFQVANKNRVIIFPNQAIDHLVTNQSARSPISRYVVGMFRIENNNLRPRKTKQSNDRGIFQVRDEIRKIEIPSSELEKRKPSNVQQTTGKRVAKSVYQNLEQYFCNSTLHGLKYVGDSSISVGERLFWICAFFSAVSFTAYFISNLYEKYNINPVIISVNPNLVGLDTIPFPAITICNMNQAKKGEAETILQSGSDVEKMLLDDLCNSNATFQNASAASDETAKWSTVQKFMIRISQSCTDMIKMCRWEDREKSCETLFNTIITDEGLCCTFNQLPRPNIFRNPREVNDWNLTYPSEVIDWNPEQGYSKDSSRSAIPWRPSGKYITFYNNPSIQTWSGTRLGLSIVLDAETQSYYCSSTDSVGFKILLHNPIETPRMADYAFLLQPGVESRIMITPKISDATPTLRSIDVRKRLCWFTRERELRFYRNYSQRNCKLECQANYTLTHCNCVPIYLPKSRIQTICGKKEQLCIELAKANTGGLLGLFMGFSFLSAVEIVYFLTLRVCCKLARSRKNKQNGNKNESVYPFTQ